MSHDDKEYAQFEKEAIAAEELELAGARAEAQGMEEVQVAEIEAVPDEAMEEAAEPIT